MGPKQEAQAALFFEFSLDYHVPLDHLLRSIDRFVDLDDIPSIWLSSTATPTVRRLILAVNPDASGRLLLWYSFRATTLRGGAFEPRLSLVLPS